MQPCGFSTICFIMTILFLFTSSIYSQESGMIQLPKPQMSGGKPLMEALKDRQTSRSFSLKKIPDQILSNLLWAAWGINRPESGRHTAPSAANWQEIDVYVSTPEGLYLYDAKKHLLQTIYTEDIRSWTGQQSLVEEAPLNLIYIADFTKMTGSLENKVFYSACDVGFIAQNVYLFCASEGLATVVRGLMDREALAQKMKLKPDQRVLLAQTVGYPK